MKEFEVTLEKSSTQKATVIVEADSAKDAAFKAASVTPAWSDDTGSKITVTGIEVKKLVACPVAPAAS